MNELQLEANGHLVQVVRAPAGFLPLAAQVLAGRASRRRRRVSRVRLSGLAVPVVFWPLARQPLRVGAFVRGPHGASLVAVCGCPALHSNTCPLWDSERTGPVDPRCASETGVGSVVEEEVS